MLDGSSFIILAERAVNIQFIPRCTMSPLMTESSPVGVQWNQCGVSNVSDVPLTTALLSTFAAVGHYWLIRVVLFLFGVAQHSYG